METRWLVHLRLDLHRPEERRSREERQRVKAEGEERLKDGREFRRV